jgi:hypothetical protein
VGGVGEVVQIMHTHVSKCKIDKITKIWQVKRYIGRKLRQFDDDTREIPGSL